MSALPATREYLIHWLTRMVLTVLCGQGYPRTARRMRALPHEDADEDVRAPATDEYLIHPLTRMVLTLSTDKDVGEPKS